MNKPPYIVTGDSITVIWDGKPHTLSSDNPNYQALYKALLDANYDSIPDLLTLEKRIADFTSGSVSVKNGEVFYKNHKLAGVVINKLLQFLREGSKDSSHILNFINRLMANPSSNSVEQLYSFLSYKNLPITPDGFVIAYKGLRGDFYSRMGNLNTIVLQGEVDSSGHILNKVGATIEVERRCVDDNMYNHCSHGLHCGSYDYAKDWAGSDGRLVMVEFDPADAVSVPTDCSFQKLRVCKYRVLQELSVKNLGANAPLQNASYDTGTEIPVREEGDGETTRSLSVNEIAIKNYVQNRLANNNPPTIKEIQSRLKNGLTCLEIEDLCLALGFSVERDEGLYISQSTVVDETYIAKNNSSDDDLDLGA